jgi:hypothetical protein
VTPAATSNSGAARETAVDHHRDAVERDRGLGDAGREHNPPAPFGVAADRGALRGGLDLAVERQDRYCGQPIGEPLARAFDLADAGEEGEHVAFLLAPGRQDRARHRLIGAHLGTAAEPFDPKRVRPPFALDHRRITHERGEAGAVDRRRHHDDPQVLAQHRLAFKRQREAEVAVEVPLVRLVEQHRRDSCQLLVAEDPVDEDRLGDDEDPRGRGLLAVEPGEIADAPANGLSQELGDPFGRSACGDTARAEQDDLPGAPGFIDQRRRDSGRLARARRRDEHRAAADPQRGKQLRQDGVDREFGRHVSSEVDTVDRVRTETARVASPCTGMTSPCRRSRRLGGARRHLCPHAMSPFAAVRPRARRAGE